MTTNTKYNVFKIPLISLLYIHFGAFLPPLSIASYVLQSRCNNLLFSFFWQNYFFHLFMLQMKDHFLVRRNFYQCLTFHFQTNGFIIIFFAFHFLYRLFTHRSQRLLSSKEYINRLFTSIHIHTHTLRCFCPLIDKI